MLQAYTNTTPWRPELMEWQNILSWKAPIRTIESSSWIHTEPPKIQILHLRAWLKCFLNCNSLGAVTTLLSNSANACAPSRPAAVGCVISAARCAIEATWPFTRACPGYVFFFPLIPPSAFSLKISSTALFLFAPWWNFLPVFHKHS